MKPENNFTATIFSTCIVTFQSCLETYKRLVSKSEGLVSVSSQLTKPTSWSRLGLGRWHSRSSPISNLNVLCTSHENWSYVTSDNIYKTEYVEHLHSTVVHQVAPNSLDEVLSLALLRQTAIMELLDKRGTVDVSLPLWSPAKKLSYVTILYKSTHVIL